MSIVVSEEAAQMVGNRFNLVLIVSARIRELQRGALPKLSVPASYTPRSIAMAEIEAGLVGLEYLERLRRTEKIDKRFIDTDLL
jgi:DNA-directed RNA polymerase subunit omega